MSNPLRPFTRRSGRLSAGNENLAKEEPETVAGRVKRTVLGEEVRRRAALGEIGNENRQEQVEVTTAVVQPSKVIANRLNQPRLPPHHHQPQPQPQQQVVQQQVQPQPMKAPSPAMRLTLARQPTPEQVLPRSQADPSVAYLEMMQQIDEQDANDPRFVSEYVGSIFSKLWTATSGEAYVAGEYLSKHPDLSDRMRATLVDWMVESHWKFRLYPETLFLSVNLLDRFLAVCPNIMRTQLQLVGISCMLIAAKYEDIYAPEIKEFIHFCDRAYRKDEILAMEQKVLNALQFNITIPSPLLYLLRLAKIGGIDERQFFLAQYCLELGFSNYNVWVKHHPALMAASTFYLSNKLLRKDNSWSQQMADMTGVSEAEVKPLAKVLCNILQSTTANDGEQATRAVKKKFSQPKYHSVAKNIL